jgi:hypothetical protein
MVASSHILTTLGAPNGTPGVSAKTVKQNYQYRLRFVSVINMVPSKINIICGTWNIAWTFNIWFPRKMGSENGITSNTYKLQDSLWFIQCRRFVNILAEFGTTVKLFTLVVANFGWVSFGGLIYSSQWSETRRCFAGSVSPKPAGWSRKARRDRKWFGNTSFWSTPILVGYFFQRKYKHCRENRRRCVTRL